MKISYHTSERLQLRSLIDTDDRPILLGRSTDFPTNTEVQRSDQQLKWTASDSIPIPFLQSAGTNSSTPFHIYAVQTLECRRIRRIISTDRTFIGDWHGHPKEMKYENDCKRKSPNSLIIIQRVNNNWSRCLRWQPAESAIDPSEFWMNITPPFDIYILYAPSIDLMETEQP